MSGKNDTKHTPGPWKNTNYQTHPNFQVLDNGNAFVAEASTEANARLIAAAPELLEALSKLVLHVGHYSSMPHAHPDAARDMANARAAIAKATGE